MTRGSLDEYRDPDGAGLVHPPRYMPLVLKGVAMCPSRSIAMTPPVSFSCFGRLFKMTSDAAAAIEAPPYSTRAQMSYATTLRM